MDIKTPQFPESIISGTVLNWHKCVGEAVVRDEVLVEIETDKVVMEVYAPCDGVLQQISCEPGEEVAGSQLLGSVDASAQPTPETPDSSPTPEPEPSSESVPVAPVPALDDVPLRAGPAVRRLLREHQLNSANIVATGKNGRLLRKDIENHLKIVAAQPAPEPPRESDNSQESDSHKADAAAPVATLAEAKNRDSTQRLERREPMSRLRRTIATRLREAGNQTAMLTTFNEVNMDALIALRKRYRDRFQEQHGVRLGYMSFFVAAAVDALQQFPVVNASIDGEDIVYHGYQDIGIAVSSQRGLVVPVLRDANTLSLAETEAGIADFGTRAQSGALRLEELQGGTFTISNGGVFGSMLSTPILNPPQTAILGMHNITERPIVLDGEVVIRPIMYVALSYDHRLLDGREAVQFLVRIKELVESPERLLLGV